MADVVQYRLERMVDELDELEQRGLFSRREIAEIVKQRRKFEYRLKRPSPLKQDFLAYIEYETQLDALRSLRRKLVGANEMKNEGNKKKKKSKSDIAGVVRIMDIYELALKRYKGDIDLWFRFLEFCRLKKNGRMKKVTCYSWINLVITLSKKAECCYLINLYSKNSESKVISSEAKWYW